MTATFARRGWYCLTPLPAPKPPKRMDPFVGWLLDRSYGKTETCPCWPACRVIDDGPVRLGRRDETVTEGSRR
jgi:hypothetical protein